MPPTALPAAARGIRARLSEVAQRLGIRLPVYVMFTKADRIPHSPITSETSRGRKCGTSSARPFPSAASPPSSYSEKAYKEIEAELQRLFSSLAAKRLKFLPRENQTDIAAGAYEFPRELRKLIPAAPSFSWSCVVRASSRSARSSGVFTLSAYGRSSQANRLMRPSPPPR